MITIMITIIIKQEIIITIIEIVKVIIIIIGAVGPARSRGGRREASSGAIHIRS